MQVFVDFINGKKTYIMIAVAAVDAVGAQLKWWEADSIRQIVEAMFTTIFLRMGVTKSGPV